MGQEITSEEGIPVFPKTAPVIKRTLVVSTLLHIFILIGLQKTFSVEWIQRPLKTYRVELLRPPIDPVDEVQKAKTELSKTEPEKKVGTEESVDTISLDTKDKRYTSYVNSIKARLSANWGEYPVEAWENLIEGDVVALFKLNRQGHLLEVHILSPSSHEILNRVTERTIRASAPFPPFPRSVTADKLNIKAYFRYRL